MASVIYPFPYRCREDAQSQGRGSGEGGGKEAGKSAAKQRKKHPSKKSKTIRGDPCEGRTPPPQKDFQQSALHPEFSVCGGGQQGPSIMTKRKTFSLIYLQQLSRVMQASQTLTQWPMLGTQRLYFTYCNTKGKIIPEMHCWHT